MNTKNIDIYWDFENVRIPNKTNKINTITIINKSPRNVSFLMFGAFKRTY